mgnify:CR=1 FL=1
MIPTRLNGMKNAKKREDIKEEGKQLKHKNLLVIITAVLLLIIFAGLLKSAMNLGLFGVLLLIALLMMSKQFSSIIDKIQGMTRSINTNETELK